MKFIVEFVIGCPSGHTPGLRAVDAVREQLGLPKFPLERIPVYAVTPHSISVEIEERVARASGLFNNCSYIKVKLPNDYPKEYVCKAVRSETGEVTQLDLSYQPDRSQTVLDWEVQGFPETME